MKTIILALLFSLFINLEGFAQQFPEYGLLTKEEINLKECAFDKEADAVVLIHEAISNYDDQHRLVTYHHVKLKIFTNKGFPSASVVLPFYRQNEFETIDQVEGMTLNPSENLQVEKSKLERKSIFTQKENERIGKVVFTFPAIQAGSIINYKYRSTMKHYGGLEDWNFQERLPVLQSKYKLFILPNVEFAYRVNKSPELPIVVKKVASEGSVNFEMQNIPGLGNEPYMDSRNDYLQKVTFQLSGFAMGTQNSKKYMTSWDEAIRELLNTKEFGSQLGKNIPGTEEFLNKVRAIASPEEKMKSVFNYVRSGMNWNGLYSKYSVDGVKDAWQKKTGNSADINLILTNLLKDAGIEAYPMLVSERFHGKVNISYPFLDQFNSVFVCANINNRKYYLDATDKTIPAHLTPVDILNTTAFVVNRKAGGLVNITNDTAKYKESVLLELKLADNGLLNGEVTVSSSDYARILKLEEYKTDRNIFLNKYFKFDGGVISPEDLQLSNIGNDSLPLKQHAKFSTTLNTTEDFSFLPLNLFTGFEVNPFLSEHRFSNINFGYGRYINLNLYLQLPENYVVDELPKSIKLTNPEQDIIFIRQLSFDKESSSISCMLIFDFKKSLYEADTYPVIKEMYQKIFKYLSEPLILKKKASIIRSTSNN